jgi:Family of unknown function (DUF6527)
MAKLSNILRSTQDYGLMWYCPGCEMCHGINYDKGPGPRWIWNNDVNKPTFSPSVLVHHNHPAGHTNENPAPVGYRKSGGAYIDDVCHSFVTDGKMQLLSDCTHKLAGQTVDIPEYWKDDEA